MVVLDGFRMCLASGDKPREPFAAGGLANWLVPEVETPADPVTAVGQAGMLCPAVHEPVSYTHLTLPTKA